MKRYYVWYALQKPSIQQYVLMSDPKKCKKLVKQAKSAEAATMITQLSSTAISSAIDDDTNRKKMNKIVFFHIYFANWEWLPKQIIMKDLFKNALLSNFWHLETVKWISSAEALIERRSHCASEDHEFAPRQQTKNSIVTGYIVASGCFIS